MRAKRAGLGNMVMWLASGTRARAAWSMSLYEIGAGATRSGNAVQNAGVAAQAGKALATINDKSEWGGLDFLASDAFVAEEDVQDREFTAKDDADADTPGLEPWRLEGAEKNIRLAKPLEALVARANKVGPGFEKEHVAYPVRAQLIAHHRPDDPPINSTWVYDPGDGKPGDWRAGLHGPVRVRRWVDDFCAPAPDPKDTGANFTPPEETFALLLNATKSGGDNSGWLAAHFAGAEAVLSAERFGFAHPADDGNHTITSTDDAPVMEGGLEAYRTKFGSRGSLLYSPLAMSPEQWPFPGKQIFPVLTEIREDYTDTHARNCGKRAPGYKKLVTWIPICDWGPPTDDPPRKPPEDPPPTDDPPPVPKYPGLIKVPLEGEDPGTPDLFGDAPAASDIDRAAGVVRDANYGERAATVMGQLECTSIQIRGRPALPDGQLQGRLMGATESDNLAGLMYGYTVRQALEAPVVADFVGSPDYINSSPNDNDDPNRRWQAVLSNEARFSFDDIGGITGRVPARGRGSVMLMPSNAPVDLQYVENKNRLTSALNATTLIVMASQNAAGYGADGRFGLGLRTLTSGRIASGYEFRLGYDGAGGVTDPDLHLYPKAADGTDGISAAAAKISIHSDASITGRTVIDDALTVGAEGNEPNAIKIDNTTTQARIMASNLGGSNPAALLVHQHSSTVSPKIYLSRSNSDNSSHTAVTNGQELGSVLGVGYAHSTPRYLIAGEAKFSVDDAGTVGATSMPGRFSIGVTKDSAKTPTERLSINRQGTAKFTGDESVESLVVATDATNGPKRSTIQKTFTTLSAGATTLIDLALADPEAAVFDVSIVATTSGGATNGFYYRALIGVAHDSGVITLGTPAVLLNDDPGAVGYTVSFSDSGSGDLRITVNDGSTNVTWKATIVKDMTTGS